MDKKRAKYLISGGGTGGHIFPAVSIANALRELDPECDILFVGALGRMEMERVPAAGYPIVGLPIQGFDRSHLLNNVKVLWHLMKSMHKARTLVKQFKPDVAIGVGGYASGAALKAANQLGVPTLLQEQNGFAGVTNKLLAKKAKKICVAYRGMERFFPADRIILTGNPVRQNLTSGTKEEALKEFGFTADVPILLVIGGSLGARTINQSILAGIDRIIESGVQLLWQTGKGYIDEVRAGLQGKDVSHIVAVDFVSRMDLAYAMADVVISRAGASSISELCLLGKASILVPSPNVAEDHQRHNAMALVEKDAALFVADVDANAQLVDTALDLIKDKEKQAMLRTNIKALAQLDSANRIAREAMLLNKSNN